MISSLCVRSRSAGVYALASAGLLLLGQLSVAHDDVADPLTPGSMDGAVRWQISDDLSVEQIHPDVWMHTSRRVLSSGAVFPSNGLLVRSGDGLVLVDTAWGEPLTAQLLDWIEGELKMPVHAAVATHFHADSAGGARALAEREIAFFAHPLTRTLMGPEHEQSPEALPEPLPLRAVGDRVRVGAVEVFFPGAGHSLDNVAAWVPNARVLFGSCAVRSPAFSGKGNTADGDLDGWPLAIARLQKHYPQADIVVPGHGRAGGTELLAHTRALFDD